MHFAISFCIFWVSPLLNKSIILRRLKSVKSDAEHVAAHVPQEIQKFNVGSAADTVL